MITANDAHGRSIARQLLLGAPALAARPRALEEAVEADLRRKYPEAPLSPEKVAARFVGK